MTKKIWLAEQNAQVKLIEKWPARLEKIGKKDAQFCDDNDIDRSQFNRIKNVTVLATKESFEQIEAALTAEENSLAKAAKKKKKA